MIDDDESRPEQGASEAQLSDGAEHLQAAAKEMIAAARSFLDVAEEAIEDSAVVDEMGTFFKNLVARATDDPRPTEPEDPPKGSRVRRINVE